MDSLSDELLRAVLSFLPSVEDLKAFALTSPQWYHWIFGSQAADGLFLDLYVQHFHSARHHRHQQTAVQGRQLWKNLYNIRHGIRQQQQQHRGCAANTTRRAAARASSPVACCCGQCGNTSSNRVGNGTNNSTISIHSLHTIEILPPEEEAEALLYDNPDLDILDRQACVGYFGMQPLARGAVAIWGDFTGLRVAPSWDALLNLRSRDRDRLVAVQDEKQTQVMDLRVHPEFDNRFFLAFASGVVMAVVMQDDNELKVKSSISAHKSEVTSLAIVPGLTSSHPGYLLSADVNGNVILYPDALNRMSLHKKVLLCQSHNRRLPVFSMSATVFGPDQIVLCLGGQGLKLLLWELHAASDGGLELAGTQEFEIEHTDDNDDEDLEEEEEQVDHTVTYVSFVGPVKPSSNPALAKKEVLVVGTSRGHLMTRDLLGHAEDPRRPHLDVGYTVRKAHLGSVESTERIGNMLLSTGGKDGVARAIDLLTGTSLATLSVHPGRLLAPRTPGPPLRLKCAVVTTSVCHERQSIICLCRDGQISEWSFEVQMFPQVAKRGALAIPIIGKRARRSTSNYPSAQSLKAPRVGNAPTLSADPGLLELDRSDVPAADSVTVQAKAARRPQLPVFDSEELDIPSLLDSLPEVAKDYFGQVGFVKWGKLQLPVLVCSPLNVSPGPVRDAWVNAFHQSRRRRNDPTRTPLLVHWYGCKDARRAYSVASCSKYTPYEQGVANRFHEIPAKLLKRQKAGLSVSRSQQDYIDGLSLLPVEAAKDKAERSHLLKHVTSDDICESASNG